MEGTTSPAYGARARATHLLTHPARDGKSVWWPAIEPARRRRRRLRRRRCPSVPPRRRARGRGDTIRYDTIRYGTTQGGGTWAKQRISSENLLPSISAKQMIFLLAIGPQVSQPSKPSSIPPPNYLGQASKYSYLGGWVGCVRGGLVGGEAGRGPRDRSGQWRSGKGYLSISLTHRARASAHGTGNWVCRSRDPIPGRRRRRQDIAHR